MLFAHRTLYFDMESPMLNAVTLINQTDSQDACCHRSLNRYYALFLSHSELTHAIIILRLIRNGTLFQDFSHPAATTLNPCTDACKIRWQAFKSV